MFQDWAVLNSNAREEFPEAFTVCSSIKMVLLKDVLFYYINFLDNQDRDWFHVASIRYSPRTMSRGFFVGVGHKSMAWTSYYDSEVPIVPLLWEHHCFSLDTVSGRASLVVNGIGVMIDRVIPEFIDSNKIRPLNIKA